METSKTFVPAAEIEYSAESTVSRMILRKPNGNITLFAFDAGQSLSEHSAPFDAFVQAVDGTGIITINKIDHELSAGQCIIMPANVPHAVKAPAKFKMMLIMIKGD